MAEPTWSFQEITIVPVGAPDSLQQWPTLRIDDYDEDLVWIPGYWTFDVEWIYTEPQWGAIELGELIVAGGGRYNKQLIAIGHGSIYFESLT